MAINLEAMNQKKTTIMTKLSDSVKGNDPVAMESALNEWQEFVSEAVMNEAKGLFNAADSQILAARGCRALTSKETEYYNAVIAAMRSADPKAAISNIDKAFPETIIDEVMNDMKQAHPLLDAIDFVNTTLVTKWVLNTKGVQTAQWGKINSAIVKELEGSIDTIQLGMNKLTAFFQIAQDMLDLGPVWVDRYIRAILTDALATGLEAGFVSGTGKDMPIGMDKNLDGGTTSEGEYIKKTAITVPNFSPVVYGDLVSKLATIPYGEGEEPRYRTVNGLILVVHPLDYYRVVGPATTVQTPDGKYINDVLPFPTKIVQSAAITQGEAILGIAKRYFAGVGTGKNGKLEYSDEFAFLDDLRTYKIKAHCTAMPKDNNSFLLLDITSLAPTYFNVAEVTGNTLGGVTVAPEAGSKNVFGYTTSSLQTGVQVKGSSITGTLKYIDSGTLAQDWGAGNFLVLKFSNVDTDATSVKVGLSPSQGSGLVELLGDPDMNGVFKITDKKNQKFKVVSSDGYRTTVQTFDLSGLTLEDS